MSCANLHWFIDSCQANDVELRNLAIVRESIDNDFDERYRAILDEDVMNNVVKRTALQWLVICIAALFVIATSATDEFGGMTADSSRYLNAAEHILESHTFWVPNDGRAPAGDEFFATWPVGYPFLIACFAFVLPVGTFWASKLVNLLFLGLVVTTTQRRYGTNGLIASLILMCASMLTLTSLTLSDSIFVCLLILLSNTITTALDSKSGVRITTLILLLLLLVGAMSTRYVGVSALPVTIVAAAMLFRRGRRTDAVKVLCTSIIAAALFGLYVWVNIANTGYPTGIPRHAPPEPAVEILAALVTSIVGSIAMPLVSWNTSSFIETGILVVCILAVVVVGWRVIKSRPITVDRHYHDKLLVLAIVSGTYIIVLLYLRLTTYFDPIDNRLIAPGVIPVIYGVVLYGLARYPHARMWIVAFVAVSYTLGVVARGGNIFNRIGATSYSEASTARQNFYANVPDSSIVIQPSDHIRYLRPNVHVAIPHRQPYDSESESIESFLGSLDWGRRVFLDTRHVNAEKAGYHESVLYWIRTFPSDTLVEVRRASW